MHTGAFLEILGGFILYERKGKERKYVSSGIFAIVGYQAGHLTNNTSRAWVVRKDRPSSNEVVNHLLTIVADVAARDSPRREFQR